MKLKVLLSFLMALILLTPFQITFAQDANNGGIKQPVSVADAKRIAQLEALLENLRQELKIPAYSAAIVKDQKVVWARGFGYADLEGKVPATEHTAYHLASLTKTFASTVVMKLIQDGKVNLDDPVSKYGITLDSPGIVRVRHLLSHTSEGNPGEQYRYNGNRFAELDKVIQKATGKSFAELLIADILEPLGMNETAPNVPDQVKMKSPAGADEKAEAAVKAALTEFYAAVNNSNVDQMEKYLDPQQNGFLPHGGLLEVFADLNGLRNAFKQGLKLNYQIHELDAAVYGDSALMTCILTRVITPPNQKPVNEGPWRSTYFWNRQGGAWKLVHTHQSDLTAPLATEKQRARFAEIAKILAKPYRLDDSSNPVLNKYPKHFSTSSCIMTTLIDIYNYDIAIDQNKFLNKETQQLAFTPAVSTKGESLPYGLGWFTQNYRGTKLLWHYGYWESNSSLIIKVPERNITFIIMANTDNLSRPTDLGAGDVTSSPVGLAFLHTFIFPEIFASSLPQIDWKAPVDKLYEQLKATTSKDYADLYKKQLLVQARVSSSVGRAEDSMRMFQAYGKLYSKSLPAELVKQPLVAEIARVADNDDKTTDFTLDREKSVRIYATGEGLTGQMYDYGWIENADTGKVVWEMKEPQTRHAGGAGKNRAVDTVITLPAGKYRLRYKSDDSHSFDRWNSLPPDINFWGIAVYANQN